MNAQENKIMMLDGTQLFSKVYERGKKVWFIAVHGIGEHSGRHEYLPELFSRDYNICQFDLRGHGQSEGKEAYIDDFQVFMEDLVNVIKWLEKNYKMQEFVLFGHSMGALICSSFIQNYAEETYMPKACYLSSPPVGVGGALGKILKLLPLKMSFKMHSMNFSLPLPKMVNLGQLSHNKKTEEEFKADPYVRTSLHSKLLFGLVHESNKVFSRPLRYEGALFASVGSKDKVVSADELIFYFKTVERKAHLKVIQGAYHEVHNEISKYRTPYFAWLKECLLPFAK